MSIQNTVVKNVYAGNGSTTIWPYTFEIRTEDINHIKVLITGTGTSAEIETEVTNFTVDSANKQVTYPNDGTDPLPSGAKIAIIRNMPYTQDLNLENQGPFFSEDIESQLDRTTMALQQLADDVSRAVKVQSTSSTTADELIATLEKAAADAQDAASAAATSEANAAESAEDAAETVEAGKTAISGLVSSGTTSLTNTINNGLTALGNTTTAGVNTVNAAKTEALTEITPNVKAAADSATAAANSASAAATSETNAATSESNADKSASAAGTSESNAKTSETNAGKSASAAATSESNAGKSASAAATSETNAGKSASAAATSETNAKTSEKAAASSAESAAKSAAIIDPDAYVTKVQGTEYAGKVLTVGDDGNVAPSDPPSGIDVGMIIPYAGNGDVPVGFLLCNGAEVGRTTYPDLFTAIGTTYGEGDGSTTFNLPDLRDKFIEGSASAGTKYEAGLPNIKGSTDYGFPFANTSTTDSDSNAFSVGDYITKDSDGTSSHRYYKDTFSAQDYNSIYGNSDTVQPPALTMRYIIKAFAGASASSTDLEITKVANDLVTVTADMVHKTEADYVVETGASSDGTLWFRKWKSGWLEQGGLKAADNTTVTFAKSFANTSYSFTFICQGDRSTSDDYSWYLSRTANSTTLLIGPEYGYWYACGQGADE